jgi:hypothetical protein
MGDRQVIKINESQFRQIISESIFNSLNEYLDRMASSAMRSLGTVDKPSDLAKGTYRQLRSDTWNPQKGKAGIQKNSWLVHITDKETGYEIMKNGFMSKLSDLNFRATQDEDFTNKLSKNGLCFAFELERDDSWVYELDEYKEDCCAIIFQANGFNAFSSFGDLYEVIFNANSAHNLLMVLPMTDEENERYLRHHPDTEDLFIGVKIVDRNGKVLRYCNSATFFGLKNGFKVKGPDNTSRADDWLNNASVQYKDRFLNK